jgi:hypothetical protein
MRYILYIGLLLSCAACRQEVERGELQAGDLLFQSTRGDLGGAIEEVTQGVNGNNFSHVGMLVPDSSGGLQVIEAFGDRVQLTSLDSFLRRGTSTIAARVKDEYRPLLPAAIAFAIRQTGVPYDDAYLYDNGKYYCSELIYDAFLFANHGQPFFILEPMTFKSSAAGEFPEEWVIHYQALGIPIPEGEPGCNPGGLSRSDKITILGLVV